MRPRRGFGAEPIDLRVGTVGFCRLILVVGGAAQAHGVVQAIGIAGELERAGADGARSGGACVLGSRLDEVRHRPRHAHRWRVVELGVGVQRRSVEVYDCEPQFSAAAAVRIGKRFFLALHGGHCK